ncbi:MAG: helix-turn-helix transcriptional regulator [Caulobacter sp.]|nr:helix-turn-helix transcriptional regulator [Vitreoscilla sp.]
MKAPLPGPGEAIRAVRKRVGLTLTELSGRTGLAVSTLSKLEMGHVSLSYDKLMLISKGLDIDMAELLDSTPHPSGPANHGGRRVVQHAGEGQHVETRSYSQTYLATELLNKRMTPIHVEHHARTLAEFVAEFGDFIRHPGEEFTYVIEGEIAFHTELYAPLLLKAGDSIYFDSEMGHAYLKAAEGSCRTITACSPRGRDETMKDTFVNASVKHASVPAPPRRKPVVTRAKPAKK